jgi:carbon-monoxide dehydrogenase medium subunit
MAPFDFARPTSLDEAVRLLDPDDPDVRPVGGGTAIMLMMKAGVLRPTRLVFLQDIEAKYSEVGLDAQGNLRIGGMTRLATLEHSPIVREDWPVLARAFKSLSNVRVRNVATLGGNLAHADPHMDMPPILSALGARVVVAGPEGRRTVPVDQLCTGYYETVLARNELICEIIVPPQGKRRAAYMKVTTRAAHDWPALGVAAVFDTQPDGRIGGARLFVGAATDCPTRLGAAEKILNGSAVTDSLLRSAGAAAADELHITGDSHGSASYKKQLLRVYLGRTVRRALDAQIQGAHA